MSAILIKNAPPRVHAWLKTTATENRRSMAQQAIWCFEQCMGGMARGTAFPGPVLLAGGPLTLDEIDAAKKAGRK